MDLLFFAYADQHKDLPALQQEARNVYSFLAPGMARNCYTLHRDSEATTDSIRRHLSTFRDQVFLFHYSGHAGDDTLQLEDGSARTEGIAHLLAQCPRLQLIVLNGCSTYAQLHGLRTAGVRATVIATHSPVEDRSAMRFAETFYQQLSAGDAVGQAFEQGIGGALLSKDIPVVRSIAFDLLPEARDSPVWGIFPPQEAAATETRLPGVRELEAPLLRAAGFMYGRGRELETILTLLKETSHSALAITGGPGIGKSTLCLSAMHHPDIANTYGARRYFVSCEGATSAGAVMTEMSKALGITPGPQQEERTWAKLRQSPALIAIDNAETPFAAGRAGFEELLGRLSALPQLTLLLTIRGEELPHGPAWKARFPLKRLDDTSGKQAFLAHATSRFADDPQLDTLLQKLDGLPLAIVLMASQTAGELDSQRLLRRWEEKKTELLQRGAGADRLTNLGISLELSLQSPRMDEAGLHLFRILGQLPDGVSYPDLSALAPKHGEAGARTLIATGLARYQGQRVMLLAPVREYAAAYYVPDEETQENIISHFVNLAEGGIRVGEIGGDLVAARITDEFKNIEKALKTLLKNTPLQGIQVTISLSNFILFTGAGNTTSLLDEALNTARITKAINEEANCLLSMGKITASRSDIAQARTLFEQAMSLYEQVGDLLGKANCLLNMGDIALNQSDNTRAQALFEQALHLYEQMGNQVGIADCLLNMGGIASSQSDNTRAQALFEQALHLYEQVGNQLGKANCLLRMGSSAYLQSDNTQAQALFEQALHLYEQVGNQFGISYCLRGMGDIALRQSDNARAQALFEQTLLLHDQVDDLLGKANCLLSMGDIAFRQFDNIQAQVLFEQALHLYEQVGNQLCKANCLQGMAKIASRQLDNIRAQALFEQALHLYEQVGNQLGKANCLQGIGDIALRQSNNAKAQVLFEQALPFFEQAGDPLGKANCLRGMGYTALQQSDNARAQSLFEQAIHLYEQVGNQAGIAYCLGSIGGIASSQSDNARAQSLFEQALPLYEQVGDQLGKANCLQSMGDIDRLSGATAEAQKKWEEALSLYQSINDHYSMGFTYRRLASISRSDEKIKYINAAVECWQDIDRDDLIERFLLPKGCLGKLLGKLIQNASTE